MRVALVHDWLTGMRGGEKCLDAICELYPRADLYTLLHVPGSVSPNITARDIHKSFLQKVPAVEKRYRHLLPLMPTAIERFNMEKYDLVISSSHCVAKGIKKRKDAIHISYIYTPMRYIWDMYDEYFSRDKASIHVRTAMKMVRGYLQNWDVRTSTSDRVDRFVAISDFVGQRVKNFYKRDYNVVYPFVELDRFHKEPTAEGGYYLILSAFAPYKKLDLAIRVFNKLGLQLRIIGSGQDEEKLKKLAGPTIEFLGQLKDKTVTDVLYRCKAFVFPGLEDFGITPLEAMACGKPVIAYKKGGVTETVTEKTGIFFEKQDEKSLEEAVMKFEKGQITFDPKDCRKRAEEFSRDRFKSELARTIEETLSRH